MTHPMVKARLRPRIAPILPPVIINDAMTSVYIVIAVWMPATVVSRSLATVAIDTFITDESRIITNWAAASVTSTAFAAAPADPSVPAVVELAIVLPAPRRGGTLGPMDDAATTSEGNPRLALL